MCRTSMQLLKCAVAVARSDPPHLFSAPQGAKLCTVAPEDGSAAAGDPLMHGSEAFDGSQQEGVAAPARPPARIPLFSTFSLGSVVAWRMLREACDADDGSDAAGGSPSLDAEAGSVSYVKS